MSEPFAAYGALHSRDRAERDAAFRRAVDEAKDRHNISDIVARIARVVRAGPLERKSLCPFHKERSPSFLMNDAKGTFHCFGCGSSGDIVTLVMRLESCDFIEALRWLGASDLPVVDPAQRVKAAAEDVALREAAIAEARRIWDKAIPAAGTPAEVYARSRGITMALPPAIRFAETYAWVDRETGEYGPDLPAMIGGVTDVADQITGIQRIFLREGGRAKAKLSKPKLTLGRFKGGALRLDGQAQQCAAAEIIITEGPEDGLSIAQELPGARVWVALGTANMPEIAYPNGVRAIVVAGQNDGPGRVASEKAAYALVERGFRVRTMYPPEGFKDWNDALRGVRS